MKIACVAWLVIYVLLVLGFAAWFFLQFPALPTASPALPEDSFRIKVSLIAGCLVALPALFALSMLYTGWQRLQERAQLARASEGGLPADGKQGVFYGPIYRNGPPLIAPLSRRSCLLYRYEVSHIETRSNFGKNRTSDVTITDTIVDAEGFALTPSAIQTSGGPIKLLTLVKPEFRPDRFSFAQVDENYKVYMTNTRLMGCGSVDANRSLLQSLLKDTDGAIRYDLGTGMLDSTKSLLIKEHIIQHGDEVVVFGKYSAATGGIVYDPDSIWDTRLRKGSLGSLKKGLALNAFGYLLGAAAWCAVTMAGTWVFFRFGPSSIWG